MRNSPRLGIAVAAAALVGLSSDSAEGLDGDGEMIQSSGIKIIQTDGCPQKTQELAHRLSVIQQELQASREQTHAQAAQIDELLMQRDTAEAVCETACEDSSEGCSVGHERGM